MTERSLLIIVPARGGSKGLPGKNLATVAGMPLVGRAVRTGRLAAERLGVRARVICSTDDPSIAKAAETWGAEIPFLRPDDLAADGSASIDVVVHAIESLDEASHTIVLLQPTSPLTEPSDVEAAVRLHWESGAPVVSVTKNSHPVEWSYSLGPDGLLEGATQLPHQRQASVATVRLNGAVYVSSADALLSTRSFVTPETLGYLMPEERSWDIDSREDLHNVQAAVASNVPKPVTMGSRSVGPGAPCFVIAEAGVNHNGSLDIARQLIDVAVESGADAVKFQTFRAEKLATPSAKKAHYQTLAGGAVEPQLDMLRRLELSPDDHWSLAEYCSKVGILFLSTPFDEASADLLDAVGMPLFKVPSGELTNLGFIRHLAAKGKPLIMSTGMGDLQEVATAVDAVRSTGLRDLVLLHCVSSYPTAVADANLSAIATLRSAFGLPVGFSDHTVDDLAPCLAVALGACVIEKHITISKQLPGPDQQVSMEPADFKALVARIRMTESALGHGRKEPTVGEASTAIAARRSLVAAVHIDQGVALDEKMVTALRPGSGLPPHRLYSILGRVTKVAIEPGTLFTPEMFE